MLTTLVINDNKYYMKSTNKIIHNNLKMSGEFKAQ